MNNVLKIKKIRGFRAFNIDQYGNSQVFFEAELRDGAIDLLTGRLDMLCEKSAMESQRVNNTMVSTLEDGTRIFRNTLLRLAHKDKSK